MKENLCEQMTAIDEWNARIKPCDQCNNSVIEAFIGRGYGKHGVPCLDDIRGQAG